MVPEASYLRTAAKDGALDGLCCFIQVGAIASIECVGRVALSGPLVDSEDGIRNSAEDITHRQQASRFRYVERIADRPGQPRRTGRG